MVALDIVRRDLTRFARSPVRTALMFAMPLAMAGIFALVFGGSISDSVTVRVLLYDEDEGWLTNLLQGAGGAQGDDRLELVEVGEEGFQMMEDGEASALIHLPAGFTNSFLDGTPVTVEVVKNPSERFLPQAVEDGATLLAAILSQASHVFRPELEKLRSMTDTGGIPDDLAVGALSVGINQKMRGLDRYLLPPVVTLETSSGQTGDDSDIAELGVLSYFLPGLSIMGILFLAQASTRDILLERENGLLRHLLTAPVSVGDYLVGKCLSVFIVTTLGFAVLIAVGAAAGVSWGSPAAVVALVLASSLGAAGTLLLIMSLVGSQRQGDALTTIVIIVWSMLGGAFVPVDQIPSFLHPLSRSTLTFWATDGFISLIHHGGSVADIAPNLGILAAFGALFMAIGATVLRRRISAGVV